MDKNNSELILPFLPENLEKLDEKENEIASQSKLNLNAEPQLKEQLKIFYESRNMICDLFSNYRPQNKDEKIIQFFSARLFNNVSCAFSIMLKGYYQISFLIQRDILETGFLLDYFSSYPEEIQKWKKAKTSNEKRKFKPLHIRQALDERDGQAVQDQELRQWKYKLLSEYGSHVSYEGFKLLIDKRTAQIGPFFDEKKLKSCMEELTSCTISSTLYLLTNFKNLPDNFLDSIKKYIKLSTNWLENYSPRIAKANYLLLQKYKS
jgi:hypothetical protein